MLKFNWKIILIVPVIVIYTSLVYANGYILYQKMDICTVKISVSSHQRTIKFINNMNKVYGTYKTNDGFVTGFSLERNKYVTIWETGSALRTVIFLIGETSINSILDVYSYSPPEIVDIDNDGELEMIFWKGKFIMSGNQVIDRPKQAEIYKFNGNKYVSVETRPWITRFSAK
jgi:hypothetical protein